MSNLLVQNIKHTNNTTAQTIDTSGRTTVSIMNNDSTYRSDGGAVTQNLVQSLTKAWVNFNGTGTAAISDSFNISGLTDNGTGDYTVSFTNDMGNALYSTAHAGGQKNVSWGIYIGASGGPNATGSHTFGNTNPSDVFVDSAFVFLQFCGDLA